MGRWSDLAREIEDGRGALTDTRQKPVKRVSAHRNKAAHTELMNRQKAAKSDRSDTASNYLPVSAGAPSVGKELTDKDANGFLPVSAVCRGETRARAGEKPNLPSGSVGGNPTTWTGEVVSLDEWRRMTDWERHGPNGRVWNGKTQQWEQAK